MSPYCILEKNFYLDLRCCAMIHGCLCNFTNIVGLIDRLQVNSRTYIKKYFGNTNFKGHNLSPMSPCFKNIEK